ncbi:(2,3-dihydroxybenzoyl)adenylate synthase [Sphaerisporangium sp. NPDC051011]|uniref:(2,3-dihydroxybenzoyl)adenylate synthase n=1 Tax=Sphaerisporangium sp. NPDC051011 TaxID=3155792 RepID=UPI0033C76EFD
MTTTHPGWPGDAAERYRAAGHWTGRTFADLLDIWAADRPLRTALVDGDRCWTYSRLQADVDRLAAGLRRLGLRPGDRVVVQLPNRAEFVLLWFALQRVGAVPVHAMPGHRRTEIGHLLHVSGATVCVIPDRHARFDYREMLLEVLAGQPGGGTLRRAIVLGDPGNHPLFTAFGDLLEGTADGLAHGSADVPRDRPQGEPAAGDLALLLHSGGTTGLPKLIPRTHDDYAYNARAAAEICGLGDDSVYLAVLPIAFNFTLACPGVLGTLTAGGTVVVSPDPSPQTAFPLIERERVTITSLTPPLVPHWMDEAASTDADLSSLKVLQVGGARLPDDVARALGPALGVTVQQVFGMAEGLINLTRLDDPEDLVCTTQGRPISPDDEILVVDSGGAPVPDGVAGELLTRGPYTPRGYYRAEAHNRVAFTADGFYRTGDVVRVLPSGHLVVVGRVKDQINRGGEKIAAAEVEEHLLAHPAITSAALVGAPDERWGERSVAFLVSTGDLPGTRELATFLKERGLASYKSPDQVVEVAAMPLTPVGKIDKQALAEMVPPM